ncbi:hypothetical protein [Streptomyces bohaiensis]|uniref:Twin-arginine translocation signal domain-containing protein n=1 Tax=Streptomyces bohaiensis TaxID=1431344 RepID=A0ABX1CDA8_9ACTN|nr:hypothetical protein [Streptomyces bohaiensis]NJQ15883.1 hypothetical protein [Streptomyces bohaiensis]
MSGNTSRRGFLTAVAAAAGGAVALPVICAGTAVAAPGDLPVVTHPDHPAARYATGAAGEPHAEPLNASVTCGLHGRAG